ncbi:hypothetical protein ScPMuIL_005399 [Solemya velum]
MEILCMGEGLQYAPYCPIWLQAVMMHNLSFRPRSRFDTVSQNKDQWATIINRDGCSKPDGSLLHQLTQDIKNPQESTSFNTA